MLSTEVKRSSHSGTRESERESDPDGVTYSRLLPWPSGGHEHVRQYATPIRRPLGSFGACARSALRPAVARPGSTDLKAEFCTAADVTCRIVTSIFKAVARTDPLPERSGGKSTA